MCQSDPFSDIKERIQEEAVEHSPSLFIGQGPQLRGGCHGLTLKSVLRADNVYILPAHYPLQPIVSHIRLSTECRQGN